MLFKLKENKTSGRYLILAVIEIYKSLLEGLLVSVLTSTLNGGSKRIPGRKLFYL